MVLHDNIKSLCEMFLNGACNEISVLLPYPADEVEQLLSRLGWIQTLDNHGNPVFLPECRDDDHDFASWATVAPEGSDECYLGFGHL